MKKKRFLAWLTAASVSLSAFIAPYPAHTVNAMTILETNVTTASEECTMLGVYGSYYSQAQDGLDRINEIRKEACEAGNVPDPRNSSRTLAPADYVPLKWSADLERVARIRAAEGGLAFGFLASGHDRLNGKDTFSISSNGISSNAENLAYNWGTSMVSGIDQWYEEKTDWVNQTSNTVTGHYTSMINPKYTYVGLGDFYTEESSYPNTLAGEFSSSSQSLDETMLDAPMDVMQKIEVKNSYITGYILEGATAIYTDKTTALTPKVTLVNGSKSHKLWALAPITYDSSNPSAATVEDDGVVTGHKNGETVITAQSNGSVLASTTITVKCGHTKELLSSTLPTCTAEGLKIYRCEVCGESIEQKIPKTPHSYVYGDQDSEGYRTGICSVCQNTLKIIPPTTYNLWWRNSTSGSDQYSSVFPGSNPISSVIYCWIEGVDGDKNYQDMVIESSDESVISVPETAIPNSYNNQLHVLAPGITTLTIYPKYNPALKKTLTVRIGDPQSVDISTADTVLSQESYPYTGNPCTPEVSVSYHDVLLNKGTDYTLTYENNTEIGAATVIITGNGIFTGSIRKNFTITESSVPLPDPEKKSLDNCTITINPDSFVFDGNPKTPDVTVLDGDITLVKDKDYTVSYKNNINAGAAKVILSGIGNYSGSVTKEFTITESSTTIPDPETKTLDNCTITIAPDSFVFDGNPKTPNVTVLDGDITLTEGKDYNVSYSDNINAGTAKVILSGIGNYSGSVTKEFTITESSTTIPDPETKTLDNCTITISPDSFVFDGNPKTPNVTVLDGDITLVKDKDYTVSYKNNINAGAAKVILSGIGNYSGSVTKEFTITESSTTIPDPETKTLDNCTITISPDSFVFDGNPKTPDVTVLDGDITLVKGKDYTVSYKNNINAGTAKVILSGIGNYSGSVTKEFSITESVEQKPEIKEISKCTIMLGQTSYIYDGTAKTPSVTVKDGNKVLIKNTDFTFIYKNNINAGTAQIIITGKGTYKGEVTKTFTITVKNGTSHKAGFCQFKVTGTSTVSLTGIKDNKVKKLTIPKTVKIGGKTFKVTAIASNAFKNNRKITNVQIGDNVKTIGTSAFEGCTKLTKATLGKNTAEIGSNAFKNCRKLNTITIKSTKLKKVGKNALKGIKPTAKVRVPSKKLSAYKKLFKNKGQGKKVKIVK